MTHPTLRRGTSAYPPLLMQLHDPPKRLYVRGEAAGVFERPAVAVVGARSCSPYGSQVARTLACAVCWPASNGSTVTTRGRWS